MPRNLVRAGGRRIAAVLTIATASTLLLSGLGGAVAASAQTTAAQPSPVSQSVTTPTSAQELASFNARLPLLRSYLAKGDTLRQALTAAGYPALNVTLVTSNSTSNGTNALVIPRGASCQSFTCGWKFSASTTYDIQYLMWIGEIAGPGGICLLFGAESAGIACTLAGAIYAVLSAYAFPIPTYTGKCLYAGIGVGEVVKLEKC